MYAGFFFSSRRRHTRWPRDWSSDVCSSDLLWVGENGKMDMLFQFEHMDLWDYETGKGMDVIGVKNALTRWQKALENDGRSEERRVGKECRWRVGRGNGARDRCG